MIVLEITRRTALYALAAVALEHLLLHQMGDIAARDGNFAVGLTQSGCVTSVTLPRSNRTDLERLIACTTVTHEVHFRWSALRFELDTYHGDALPTELTGLVARTEHSALGRCSYLQFRPGTVLRQVSSPITRSPCLTDAFQARVT